MKLNYLFGISATLVILLLASPGLTQQTKSSNPGGVNKPPSYSFGFRRNSAPISSIDDDRGNWKGYCYALIETLKTQIPNAEINILEMTREQRFTGKGGNGENLDAECGPNTINEERRAKIRKNGLDGKFSEPFARTGATALLLDKNMENYSNISKSQYLKLGVINNTTTKDLVEKKYTSLDMKKIVNLKDNQDGINQLKTNKIDVYFNDELILRLALKLLEDNNNGEKYSIQPGLLSYEDYGIIVYRTGEHQNNALLQAINSLLSKAETKKFGSTELKILKTSEFQDFENNLSYKDNGSNSPKHQSINVTPTPSPDRWIKAVYLLAILITPMGIFLLIKSYQSQKGKKLGIKNNIIESNHPLTYRNSHSNANLEKSEPSLANINNFYLHNTNSQSKTGRDDMTNNNFDQRYANNNVANQGTNTNNNTQQFVQYTYEQSQDLSQFAKDIQQILGKIEKNNPNATQAEKQNIVSYEIPTEQRSKIVRALKVGGETALQEFLDNPYLNVAIAIVKEWQSEE